MLPLRLYSRRMRVNLGRVLGNERNLAIRKTSTFLGDNEIESWPLRATNTLINICPQGYQMVIERLGKMHEIKEAGWFISIPIIDQIRYIIDMRERAMQIHPLSAITRDNVSVTVSGNVYLQFVEAFQGAYGSANPLYAITQIAQSSMRAGIGELELDEILHARQKLNQLIMASVQEAASSWGIEIKRYELTEITPDRVIMNAMDKQAAAERSRRERVLNAEGEKRAMELTSEGVKIAMRNESEGELIKVKNIAEATKLKLSLEAEGQAAAISLKAHAEAKAIQLISGALSLPQGQMAAQFDVAREYVKMYGEMGKSSNTMIFSDQPADMRALLAQAASVLKVSFGNSPPVRRETVVVEPNRTAAESFDESFKSQQQQQVAQEEPRKEHADGVDYSLVEPEADSEKK